MKILLVVGRPPWPPRRGDQIRAGQALAALAGDHEVTLLAPRARGADADLHPRGVAASESYRLSSWPRRLVACVVNGLRGAPLQQALFASSDLARRLPPLARRADLVILQLSRLERYADCVAETPLLVDLIDSLGLNLASRASRDRAWLRPLWRAEAKRLAASEDRLVARAAHSVVVSDRDRAAILLRRPELAARLGVLPLAVPQAGRAVAPSPSGRPRLLFTGNLGYFPNRDAARWLFAEIWPALRAARPELELLVAGDRPGRELRAAAARAGATLVASPPSLVELLAGASVALAPLRGGSGVPVKVLEAWAAGVPVVVSPGAVAGLAAEGEAATLGGAVRVADAPADWVAAVGQLLDDAGGRERQVAAGRARLLQRHSPAQVDAAWREAVDRASRAKRDVQAEFGSVK
ncbi:MAG: glycosyltransferase [Holophagales bacterium]|nr:MAG: glycosyltransferase [Holophagales bacterium]